VVRNVDAALHATVEGALRNSGRADRRALEDGIFVLHRNSSRLLIIACSLHRLPVHAFDLSQLRGRPGRIARPALTSR
jgi:hypothetical protein